MPVRCRRESPQPFTLLPGLHHETFHRCRITGSTRPAPPSRAPSGCVRHRRVDPDPRGRARVCRLPRHGARPLAPGCRRVHDRVHQRRAGRTAVAPGLRGEHADLRRGSHTVDLAQRPERRRLAVRHQEGGQRRNGAAALAGGGRRHRRAPGAGHRGGARSRAGARQAVARPAAGPPVDPGLVRAGRPGVGRRSDRGRPARSAGRLGAPRIAPDRAGRWPLPGRRAAQWPALRRPGRPVAAHRHRRRTDAVAGGPAGRPAGRLVSTAPGAAGGGGRQPAAGAENRRTGEAVRRHRGALRGRHPRGGPRGAAGSGAPVHGAEPAPQERGGGQVAGLPGRPAAQAEGAARTRRGRLQRIPPRPRQRRLRRGSQAEPDAGGRRARPPRRAGAAAHRTADPLHRAPPDGGGGERPDCRHRPPASPHRRTHQGITIARAGSWAAGARYQGEYRALHGARQHRAAAAHRVGWQGRQCAAGRCADHRRRTGAAASQGHPGVRRPVRTAGRPGSGAVAKKFRWRRRRPPTHRSAAARAGGGGQHPAQCGAGQPGAARGGLGLGHGQAAVAGARGTGRRRGGGAAQPARLLALFHVAVRQQCNHVRRPHQRHGQVLYIRQFRYRDGGQRQARVVDRRRPAQRLPAPGVRRAARRRLVRGGQRGSAARGGAGARGGAPSGPHDDRQSGARAAATDAAARGRRHAGGAARGVRPGADRLAAGAGAGRSAGDRQPCRCGLPGGARRRQHRARNRRSGQALQPGRHRAGRHHLQ